MRIQDLVPKNETDWNEVITQVVATLLCVWAIVALLSGCTFRTIDAGQAQTIIQGVK